MITSKSNDLIKYCIQIKQKKYSRECSKCFVESFKLVKELSQQGLVDTILVVDSKVEIVRSLTCNKIEVVSSSIANFLAETVSTDGVFAICKIPKYNKSNCSRCLILDRIQDPSNLGAILRSACAFGFKTILAINSVYPYTSKVIRASMGQIFKVDYYDIDVKELNELKNNQHMKICVADMSGIDVAQFDKSNISNLGLVIGNEGGGVSQEILSLADHIVSIPMDCTVESLNASVSAGILMYILK